MKRIFLFFLILIAFSPIFAQSLKFKSTSHDFLQLKEEGAPVETIFEFKNKSRDTILISEAKSACTCLTSVFSKEPIAPGKKGRITVRFNPDGRVGVLDKVVSLAIKKWPEDLLASPELYTLSLKANVSPRPKEITEAFPIKMGRLRMTSSYIPFDSLFTDSKRTVSVTLFNDSPELLNLVRAEAQSYITLNPVQAQIKPMDSLRLNIVVDGASAEDWGNVYYPVRLFTDEPDMSEKSFSLFGYRGDNVAKMSAEQKALLPRAKFESREAHFGKIVQGNSVEHIFRVTNEGKSDLTIRKWKPGCGCTSSQPDKMVLKPGESATSKAIFNSTGQSGVIHKSITVVTDDPIEPVVILFLHGEVEPGDANQPAKPKE